MGTEPVFHASIAYICWLLGDDGRDPDLFRCRLVSSLDYRSPSGPISWRHLPTWPRLTPPYTVDVTCQSLLLLWAHPCVPSGLQPFCILQSSWRSPEGQDSYNLVLAWPHRRAPVITTRLSPSAADDGTAPVLPDQGADGWAIIMSATGYAAASTLVCPYPVGTVSPDVILPTTSSPAKDQWLAGTRQDLYLSHF